MKPEQAAWVPDDDPHRPWSTASELALEWLDERAGEIGRRPVLVTNTNGSQTFGSKLSRFTWGTDHFSRMSAGNPRESPILSYVPTEDDLEFALRAAGSTVIAVVESKNTPVGGWAALVGATNLLTGETTAPLDPDVHKLLDRLAFAGNNGYGDKFGKQAAERHLATLRSTGAIDMDLVPVALAAFHVTSRGQKRIRDMLTS